MMSSDFVINFDRDQQAKDIGCMYATAPSDRAHIFLEQSMALPPLGGTAQLLRFLQKLTMKQNCGTTGRSTDRGSFLPNLNHLSISSRELGTRYFSPPFLNSGLLHSTTIYFPACRVRT
jgi:hypothetical protein